MQSDDGLRLCVLGAGEVGRGWAALAVAHGRAVALHDPDSRALEAAKTAILTRAAVLVEHGLADAADAERGRAQLVLADDSADAAEHAHWIIEAVPESLPAKRVILEAVEAASANDVVLASSSSGLHASALGAGLLRPERLVVVHPLVPVELMPVVEVIPGPATDPRVVEAVRTELERLGRAPVVLRREVPGNAVGRIAAAVWRECIDLVLDGVVDVEEADRLVSGGPCIGWASGGSHLTYELAAEGGMGAFLDHLQPTFQDWWGVLSARTALDDRDRARLLELVNDAYGARRGELRDERDRRLLALVRALSETDARR